MLFVDVTCSRRRGREEACVCVRMRVRVCVRVRVRVCARACVCVEGENKPWHKAQATPALTKRFSYGNV